MAFYTMAVVKVMAFGIPQSMDQQQIPVSAFILDSAALHVWLRQLAWQNECKVFCSEFIGPCLATQGPLYIVLFTYPDAPDFPPRVIQASVMTEDQREFQVRAVVRCLTSEDGERCSIGSAISAMDPTDVARGTAVLEGFVAHLPVSVAIQTVVQDLLTPVFPGAGNCLLIFHHSPFNTLTLDFCYCMGTWQPAA